MRVHGHDMVCSRDVVAGCAFYRSHFLWKKFGKRWKVVESSVGMRNFTAHGYDDPPVSTCYVLLFRSSMFAQEPTALTQDGLQQEQGGDPPDRDLRDRPRSATEEQSQEPADGDWSQRGLRLCCVRL